MTRGYGWGMDGMDIGSESVIVVPGVVVVVVVSGGERVLVVMEVVVIVRVKSTAFMCILVISIKEI